LAANRYRHFSGIGLIFFSAIKRGGSAMPKPCKIEQK